MAPNIELSPDEEEFKNIFFSHHLFPLINKPTRETKHTATVIDNIFCNATSPLDICVVGILRPYISDHHGILCVKKRLSLFHLNIRSIPDHFLEFTSFLNVLNVEFKVIALSETCIKAHHISYNLPNYNMEQNYRIKNY